MKCVFLLLFSFLLSCPSKTLFAKSWQEVNQEFAFFIGEKRYEEALTAAEQGYNIAEEHFGPVSEHYYTSLENLAVAHQGLQHWQESIRYLRELVQLELRRIAKMDVNMSTALQMSLAGCDYLHDPRLASMAWQQIVDRLVALTSLDYSVYSDVPGYCSKASMQQGQATAAQALQLLKNVQGIDLALTTEQQAALAEHNELDTNSQTGERQIAEKREPLRVQLAQECSRYRDYANYSEAAKSCKQLYTLSKKHGQAATYEFAELCVSLGELYSYSYQYEQALRYFMEGLSLWEQNIFPKNERYIQALYSQATLLRLTQRFAEEKEVLLKAEKTARDMGQEKVQLYPALVELLAGVSLRLGNHDEAELFFARYKDFLQSRQETLPQLWVNYYLGTGMLYAQQEKWRQADEAYRLYNAGVLKMVDHQFRYIALASEKKLALAVDGYAYSQDYFYSYCRKRYRTAVELAGQMYNNELLAKGFILRMLSKKVEQVYASQDQQLIDDFERWAELRGQLAKLEQLPVKERKADPGNIGMELNRLEGVMNSRLADQTQGENFRVEWQQVQENLAPGEAALEFVKIEEGDPIGGWSGKVFYGALLLRGDSRQPQFIELFEEEEFEQFIEETKAARPFEQVRRMYTWLPGKYGGQYKGDILHRLVWEPLTPFLQGITTIYYSPVGVLHKVSFNALPVAEKETLINRYTLHLLSTTALLVDKQPVFHLTEQEQIILFGGILYDLDTTTLQKQAAAHRDAANELFIHDRSFEGSKGEVKGSAWPYLEGSLTEVQQIERLLVGNGQPTELVVGEAAVEEYVKIEKGSRPEIMHIATHGFFLPSRQQKEQLNAGRQVDPDEAFKRSGLLFAGANKSWLGAVPPKGVEDGILTAYEISTLNLSDTRLVVLSACETGLGDIGGGEGVYGLQRAFKLAGVESMIMSLWQIPDAQTAELMNIFYGQWLAGQELHEAFRTAQKALSTKYEPYFWGAFVLLD